MNHQAYAHFVEMLEQLHPYSGDRDNVDFGSCLDQLNIAMSGIGRDRQIEFRLYRMKLAVAACFAVGVEPLDQKAEPMMVYFKMQKELDALSRAIQIAPAGDAKAA